MTTPPEIKFRDTDLDAIDRAVGRVAVLIGAGGKLDAAGRRVNKLTRGALLRFAESEAFDKMKPGEVRSLAWPSGMGAEAVDLVRLDARADIEQARKAGAALAKLRNAADMLVAAG
ncbi:leucyl aminopeptidase, partial [Escherichia coli]|nr:leucyl aminopeptidase [Escherichia coli]